MYSILYIHLMFFQLESIFANIVAETNGGLRGKNNLQKQQIYIHRKLVVELY